MTLAPLGWDAASSAAVLYRAIRPLLFSLDAESAHRLVIATMRPLEDGLQRFGEPEPSPHPMLRQELFGLAFENPIGLAAGLDKNAELAHVWSLCGFGFAELGTLTAVAQEGNPQPRLFRLPEDRALINRLGFNNDGAGAVAARLVARFAQKRPRIPIGINIGKSRIVPLENAVADYRASFAAVFPVADYVTINVSSPNTPGLRDLQAASQLGLLLDALQADNRRLSAAHGRKALPLLVKIAPDLAEDDLADVVAAARGASVAGLIATNTTVQRPLPAGRGSETGGLSGAPLRELSTRVVRSLRRLVGDALPIVGVGGIFDASDAYEKIRAGASLVQLYTGLIYEGPTLPRRLCRGIEDLLRRDGFAHLRDAIGTGA